MQRPKSVAGSSTGQILASPAPSVYFFNCCATVRHATPSCGLVDLHHDWVHNALELLLFCFELILLGHLVLVQPVEGLLHSLLDFVFVVTLKLVHQLLLLQGVTHGEAVVLQAVLCFNLSLCFLVFGTEFLSLLHHAVNFSLGKTALLVCDGDLVGFACGLVLCRHVQDPICINVKGYFDLGNTTWCRWDAVKVKLSQQVVILSHGTLSLEDLNQDTRLIIGIGREGLTFLCWDRCVSLDKLCHHTTSSLQAHGQGSDIKKQEVLHLRRTFPGEDGCLDGRTKSHSLIRVD